MRTVTIGKGDCAVVCIDTDLAGDVFDPRISADDFRIKLQAVGNEARVVLLDSKGRETPLKAAFRVVGSGVDRGYCFEAVVPWTTPQ